MATVFGRTRLGQEEDRDLRDIIRDMKYVGSELSVPTMD